MTEENNNTVTVTPRKKYSFIALSKQTHNSLNDYRKTLGKKRSERSFDNAVNTLLAKSAMLDQELG